MKKYNREVYLFVLNNAAGKSTNELLELVNKRFGNIFTYSTLRAYKKNNDIRSGYRHKTEPLKYNNEVLEFVKANAAGKRIDELFEIVDAKYKDLFTIKTLSAFKKNHNIRSGVNAQFQKGQTSWNKGQKMSPDVYAKCKSTMFQKGQKPHNYKPVGSERIETKDGYTLIKVKNPNVWRLKHVCIWEQANGKVPKGCMITFLDGNKSNFDLKNLVCISLKENARLNKQNLRSEFAEITQANINIVRLESKINNLKQKRSEQ